jgi:hypothetical protein
MFTGVLTGSENRAKLARTRIKREPSPDIAASYHRAAANSFFRKPNMLGWRKRVAIVECGQRNTGRGAVPAPG